MSGAKESSVISEALGEKKSLLERLWGRGGDRRKAGRQGEKDRHGHRQGERGSPGQLELRCSPKEHRERWGHYWKMAKVQVTD